jgi:type VI secretion system protein ImpL
MLPFILKLLGSKFIKAAGLALLIFLLFMVRLQVAPNSSYLWWVVAAVLLILLYIGWLIYDKRRCERQNKSISDSLVDGAKKDEASSRPDRREAYRRVRENIEYAVELLEKSQAKGSKGTALYRLPWIMGVGPPADGKTTTIRNAGIRWPVTPRMDETAGAFDVKIEGAGGTRSCNWFFSTKAIILDTAGRWQARDQGQADEEEWLEFLQMLQKHRPKRPINGVVAICSIQRVVENREEALEWAQKIRRQIDEIMERLGTHIPVYLILNKCDLIPGFVEYFQDLSQASRKQIWGFTRSYKPKLRKSGSGLESELGEVQGDLDRELDRLIDVLEQRRMHRLTDPSADTAERRALLLFPDEFRGIRGPIKEFVSAIFVENTFYQNPVLRGLYFTSATQTEGNPIVQLMRQVAGEYDIPLEALPFSTKQQVDTYFVRDLMHDVIFEDKNLGGRFKKSLYNKTRTVLAGALGLATLLIGLWMTISFFTNSYKGEDLSERAKTVSSLSIWADGDERVLVALDSMRVSLDDYRSTGSVFGLFYWLFGRSSKGELAKAGDEMLARRMDSTFIISAWRSCKNSLEDISEKSMSDYIVSYKTYLYLSDSSLVNFITADAVADYIMSRSFRRVKDDQEMYTSYRTKLSKLLEYYVESKSRTPFVGDEDLKRQASEKIRSDWRWEVYLTDILSKDPHSRESFSARNYSPVYSPVSVPHAYTATGWNEYAEDAINGAFHSIEKDPILERILGEEIANESAAPLLDAYYKNCKNEWQSFFGSLKFSGAPSQKLLDDLMQIPSSPLENFLVAAAKETNFGDPELRTFFSDLLEFTGVRGPSGVLESHLLPESGGETQDPPMVKYLNELDLVKGELGSLQDVQKGCASAYLETKGKITEHWNKVNPRYVSSEFSGVLMAFVGRPFKDAESAALGLAASCLNRAWEENVYLYFEAELKGKYPFSANAPSMASVGEISEFIGWNGALSKFNRDEAQPMRQAGLNLSQRYNDAIDLRGKISDLVSGSSPISLIFKRGLAPNQMDELSIRDDAGGLFRYNNGPDAPFRMLLPWTHGFLTIDMSLNNQDMVRAYEFVGEWAPLLLLDKANAFGRSGDLEFTGRSGVYDLKFEVQCGSDYTSPMEWIRDFDLPGKVTR